MRLFSENNEYKLYQGNMLDMLEVIEPNSIDSIVTDPPYEIGFMGRGWDATGIAFQKETWDKCLQVLKPGGYLLAFGGSRTFHRIAVAIEDAGFEIRDTIMWIYGSGMPKSMNVGKAIESKLTTGSANTQEFKNLKGTKVKAGDWGISANAEFYGARPSDYSADGHERTVDVDYQTEEGKQWDGWGTTLKPAYEPIIIARKPCEGSTTDNVLKYGVGGINIDECRIGTDVIKGGTTPNFRDIGKKQKEISGVDKLSFGQVSNAARIALDDHLGRFPANVILTYDKTDEKEVCGGFPETSATGGAVTMPKINAQSDGINVYNFGKYKAERLENNYIAPCDSGSAARYFYNAKASRRDRDEGCDGRNQHCTVKPTSLMQYLIRLVTPNGGTVLDPFNGSGSTGKACMYENVERDKDYTYIGIELDDYYALISKARIEFAQTGQLAVIHDTTTDQSQSNTVTRMKINKLF